MERHFTVTTYVIKENKVLLLFHPKFQKWLPPGGHLEPNETPPEGAKREVKEESGLDIAFITQENLWLNFWNAMSFERPYLCLLENVPPHGNQGAHQHMDLIYLATPVGGQELQEVVRWFSLEEVEMMPPDEEIFAETQKTIRHILTNALTPFCKGFKNLV